MAKFVIAPHAAAVGGGGEGLLHRRRSRYEFRDELRSPAGRLHDLGDRVGAYQTIEKGRTSDVSCACHWTVNVAASVGHGKLYADCYSVAPAGSSCRRIRQSQRPSSLPACHLGGLPIGSHYSAIQALEQHADRRHHAVVRRRAAVPAHGD
jgi:hypothetical protein